METTVTAKNMITIPQTIARKYGNVPGWKLDWKDGGKPDELIVTVIPDRAERGRRLLGRGKHIGAGKDSAAALAGEREAEG